MRTFVISGLLALSLVASAAIAQERPGPPPPGPPFRDDGHPGMRGPRGPREAFPHRVRIEELRRRREDLLRIEQTLDQLPPEEAHRLRRSIEVRRESLALEEADVMEELRERVPEMKRRLVELENMPEGPRRRAAERRAVAMRSLVEYLEKPDATFAGVVERLDAASPTAPGDVAGADARVRARLADLQAEAAALRERLAQVEREIEMLRRDLRGGPMEDPSIAPGDPDMLPQPRRFDGDRRPPNAPSRRPDRGGPGLPPEPPAPPPR